MRLETVRKRNVIFRGDFGDVHCNRSPSTATLPWSSDSLQLGQEADLPGLLARVPPFLEFQTFRGGIENVYGLPIRRILLRLNRNVLQEPDRVYWHRNWILMAQPGKKSRQWVLAKYGAVHQVKFLFLVPLRKV